MEINGNTFKVNSYAELNSASNGNITFLIGPIFENIWTTQYMLETTYVNENIDHP